MKNTYAIERADLSKIEKLNSLTNIDTYWNDVRKFTKKVTSDHSIKRWQCLAERRFEELKQICYLKFMNSYKIEMNEISSSVMDIIDSYIVGDAKVADFSYEIGSSELDAIMHLKEQYEKVLELGYTPNVLTFRTFDDKTDEVFEGLLQLGLLQMSAKLFNSTFHRELSDFCEKFNFEESILLDNTWAFAM